MGSEVNANFLTGIFDNYSDGFIGYWKNPFRRFDTLIFDVGFKSVSHLLGNKDDFLSFAAFGISENRPSVINVGRCQQV